MMRRDLLISYFAARLLTQWSGTCRPVAAASFSFSKNSRQYTTIFDPRSLTTTGHRGSVGRLQEGVWFPYPLPDTRSCHSRFQIQLFTSSSSSSASSSSSRRRLRTEMLQEQLHKLGIDADSLHQADMSSMEDPTNGYDVNFGKSAIRTYRAFLKPAKSNDKDNQDDMEDEDAIRKLSGAAGRCARQIDFLMKRHKSHQTEYIRHHDAALKERTQVFPLVLVLDNVRSAFNVGSLFRTADACGCQQVITTGITPHPFGNGADKLSKSALGAEVLVPSRHFSTTQEAIENLRKELPDFELIGMETTDLSQLYTGVKYSSKGVVLVLGNEVTGVDTKILSQLDGIVEIPTFGAKNSLNVAACAPVVLYEIIRQWQV